MARKGSTARKSKTNKLKKSGTMLTAAKEGKEFLKRSWGEEKYEKVQKILGVKDETESNESSENEASPVGKTPQVELKNKSDDEETLKSGDESQDTESSEGPPKKKIKLSKHTTMIATAKESEILLKDSKIDSDARTRRQSKEINKLVETKPKPEFRKTRTMAKTIKESETILKNSNIDSNVKTRNQSKVLKSLSDNKKSKLKRNSTMTTTAKEAIEMLSKEPLRPRAAKNKGNSTFETKTSGKKRGLKKSRTMIQTAKEGEAFVKRLNDKYKKK